MSESCQSLIICLYHTNDWWYVWIIPMTEYDSGILSVIGMIKTFYQWLVWFRHIISHWYDSDISSVIGMIQTYHQSLLWFRHIISNQWLMICLNHTNDWLYFRIIPMTDSMSESYKWLIIYLNHTNDW
jgi:hypothetical protein